MAGVVALSVASVNSAARLAVMAGEVTPCQVLAPEMVTMRARARAGLTTLLEVGMIEGSRPSGPRSAAIQRPEVA